MTQRWTGHRQETEVKDRTRKAIQGTETKIELVRQMQRG